MWQALDIIIQKQCFWKDLHTVWFQLYNILEKAKYKESKKINVARDLEEERKGKMATGAHNVQGGETILYYVYSNGGFLCQYAFFSMHKAAVQLKVWIVLHSMALLNSKVSILAYQF